MPTHAWANRVCSSVLCVLLLMTVLSACTASGGGGSPPTTIWIVDDISVSTCPLSGEEVERDCTVRAPTDQAPGERLPVIVLLHGFGGTPGGERASGGWDDAVVANRFVLVTPGGQHDGWNAGGCCGLAQSLGIDDVGYLAWLISWVRGLPIVDPGRVGLVGFSNGGMMADLFACLRPDLIATVASLAGPLMAGCPGGPGVPLLQMHGTADEVVPFHGGLSPTFPLISPEFPDIPTMTAQMAADAGCAGDPVVATTGDITSTRWDACPTGRAVELAELTGWFHVWPHTFDVDATQLVLQHAGIVAPPPSPEP